MIFTQLTTTDWAVLLEEIGEALSAGAAEADTKGTFVFENYELLKKHRFFSAMIPEELGGGGLGHDEMCHIIRKMAHYCGSTALAFSMHQHLVAATIWKYKHKGIGEETLRKVVNQQLVLISTGARDWLESNGEMERVEGGYLLSGRKYFASQSVGGDVAVTSAPFQNENGDWKVLHFPVSMKAEGVSVLDDWDVMGMRATGSQTIVFDKVFVPENTVALERKRGDFHPAWNVVLTVAMPLIMSAYVGIAEKAFELAVNIGKKYHRNQEHIAYMVGKLNNQLLAAQVQWKAMYTLTNNFDFSPNEGITSDILSYKTNVADACINILNEAMEAIGGQSFYRKNEFERLFRDIQAARFHPLPKWNQYAFTGKKILAL